MQCLHCGKKLGYLRKLGGRQFCSEAHEKQYHERRNDLALARLLEDVPASPAAEDIEPELEAAAGVQLELPGTPEPGKSGLMVEWPQTAAPAAAVYRFAEAVLASATAVIPTLAAAVLAVPGLAGSAPLPVCPVTPSAEAAQACGAADLPFAPACRTGGARLVTSPGLGRRTLVKTSQPVPLAPALADPRYSALALFGAVWLRTADGCATLTVEAPAAFGGRAPRSASGPARAKEPNPAPGLASCWREVMPRAFPARVWRAGHVRLRCGLDYTGSLRGRPASPAPPAYGTAQPGLGVGLFRAAVHTGNRTLLPPARPSQAGWKRAIPEAVNGETVCRAVFEHRSSGRIRGPRAPRLAAPGIAMAPVADGIWQASDCPVCLLSSGTRPHLMALLLPSAARRIALDLTGGDMGTPRAAGLFRVRLAAEVSSSAALAGPGPVASRVRMLPRNQELRACGAVRPCDALGQRPSRGHSWGLQRPINGSSAFRFLPGLPTFTAFCPESGRVPEAPRAFLKDGRTGGAGSLPMEGPTPVAPAGEKDKVASARPRATRVGAFWPDGGRVPEPPSAFANNERFRAAGALPVETLAPVAAAAVDIAWVAAGPRPARTAMHWPESRGCLAFAGIGDPLNGSVLPGDVQRVGFAALQPPAPVDAVVERAVHSIWRIPVQPLAVAGQTPLLRPLLPGTGNLQPGLPAAAQGPASPRSAQIKIRSGVVRPGSPGRLDGEVWSRAPRIPYGSGPLHLVQPLAKRAMPWTLLRGKWSAAPARYRRAAWVAPALAVAAFALHVGGQAGSGSLETMKGSLEKRSLIELEDDFRSGLSRWEGASGWAKDWSYDAAGFLHPGRSLALLAESRPLDGYTLEFLGQIDQRALSWVIRAANLSNYYAFKILVTKPGPLPAVVIQSYPVLSGAAGTRRQLPLPLQVRSDTLYRVKMVVQGEQFTTSINGQLVDTWSDSRLRAGGVGFFSERGEAARLRWVRVTRNDDLVGRLCSQLFGGIRR